VQKNLRMNKLRAKAFTHRSITRKVLCICLTLIYLYKEERAGSPYAPEKQMMKYVGHSRNKAPYTEVNRFYRREGTKVKERRLEKGESGLKVVSLVI